MDSCPQAHHWLIDALPTRGSYRATCKNCGEQREFPEDATRYKFRITRSTFPPPVIDGLLGLPGATSPAIPAAEEKTSG